MKCEFSNFFSNSIYNYPQNLLFISKTKFNFFLDAPVKIEETYVTDAHVQFNRVAIYDTSFICKDSTFSDCQSMFGQGGAIYSLSSTILKNCYFIRCESETGGAIYSGSDIDYFSTTFQNCIGIKAGGCIFCDHPEKTIVSFCNFAFSISASGGAFCLRADAESSFRYNNISSCGSFLSNGGFDLSYCSADLYFMILDQCFATRSTAGIRFFQNKGMSIKSSLFAYLISSESKPDEGAILTIVDPSESCLISHCSFTKTQKLSGYSIFASNSNLNDQSKLNNVKIFIRNCCFSFKKEIEFNNDTMIVFNETNHESSFEMSCDDFLLLVLPRKIGYKKADEVQEQEPILNKLIKHYTLRLISMQSLPLIFIGFALGFIIWLFYIFYFKRARRRKHRHRRVYQML